MIQLIIKTEALKSQMLRLFAYKLEHLMIFEHKKSLNASVL